MMRSGKGPNQVIPIIHRVAQALLVLLSAYFSLVEKLSAADPGGSSINSITEFDLGFSPKLTQMDAGGQNIFFCMVDENTVAKFDTKLGQVTSKRQIGHSCETMSLDNGGATLLVAGSANTNGAVSRLDAKNLESTPRSVKLGQGVKTPLLADDGQGNVYLGDAGGVQIIKLSADDFVTEKPGAAPADLQSGGFDRQIFYSGSGISAFAVSQAGEVAFVADTASSVLAALETTGKFAVLDRFVQEPNGAAALPNVIVATSVRLDTLSGKTRAVSSVESILVADDNNDRLLVIQYDPLFQTMDLAAESEFRLPVIPGLAAVPGESSLLLAADAEQQTILVASKSSNQAALFARSGSRLTLLRHFVLQDAPSALDMAEDGQSAVIIYPKNSMASRLEARQSAQESDRVQDNFSPNDISQLQELLTDLGMPVGGIDGMLGDKTLRALAQAVEGKKIDLKLEDSGRLRPEELQRALKAFENPD
jgi:hypothetical protein